MFATVGVVLAALVMFSDLRVRVLYAIAFVLFSFIGVMAVKAARRTQWEGQIRKKTNVKSSKPTSGRPASSPKKKPAATSAASKPAAKPAAKSIDTPPDTDPTQPSTSAS